MHRKGSQSYWSVISAVALCALAPASLAAPSGAAIQPGVFLHDFESPHLTLSNFRSGELCTEEDKKNDVCDVGTRFVVAPNDSCLIHDGRPIPCLRYGYRFEYSSVAPGLNIECKATQKDGLNTRQKTYTIRLKDQSGSIWRQEWAPADPVEKRKLLSEVHECTFIGEPVVSIEYIIVYEPPPELQIFARSDPTQPRAEEPHSTYLPGACRYLDADLASIWVGGSVERYEDAIEHMPNLRSHCAYFRPEDLTKRARIEHKYHLYELFDVEKRNAMQLAFHAAFAAGGHEPTAVWRDLGKVTFVFHLPPDRSQIMVVTGIQGPPDPVGRPRELLGHYHLRNENRTHEQRLECLKVLARESLDQWLSTPLEPDGTVKLPLDPEPPIRTCVE